MNSCLIEDTPPSGQDEEQLLKISDEEFEIISNPDVNSTEAEPGLSIGKDQQSNRFTSTSSEDFLEDKSEKLVIGGKGADLEREDDNLEFHLSDDQQFEVLDSAEGKSQIEKHIEEASPHSEISEEKMEQEGMVLCITLKTTIISR